MVSSVKAPRSLKVFKTDRVACEPLRTVSMLQRSLVFDTIVQHILSCTC